MGTRDGTMASTSFRRVSIFMLCMLWSISERSIVSAESSSLDSQQPGTQGQIASNGHFDGEGDEIRKNVTQHSVSAVRKMSSDPGEMFFYEYWGTADVRHDQFTFGEDSMERMHPEKVTLGEMMLQPPMLRHAEGSGYSDNKWLPRALLGRAFTCPEGTDSCKGIGRPNSCCQTGLTCHKIKDTGLGDVGCCPSTSDCSGEIAACPGGYTSCAQSLGGGCCIPGYACNGVGCVKTSTKVVVVSGTTITPTSDTQSAAATTTSGCSAGSQTCAPSLGGGCCPTNQDCAFSSRCVSRTAAAAPVRATSDAPAPSSQAPTAAATTQIQTGGPCPSNFYPCSAYFPGAGCCQIGRNCASTSCPARTTVSTVVSNGITILVEPTDGSGAQQGNCAGGWLTCGASVGGGCCPGGYNCGTVSCTATGAASGGPPIAKVNAGIRMAASPLMVWGWVILAVLYIH